MMILKKKSCADNFLPKPVHNTSSLVETPTIANSPEEKAADPMPLARPKKVKQSTKKSNPETNIQLKPKSVKNTSSVSTFTYFAFIRKFDTDAFLGQCQKR